MKIVKWDDLPKEMRVDEVKKYYDILSKKKCSLFFKRVFDIVFSTFLILLLLPFWLLLAIAIKIDSPGPVFYRQERVTQYGESFYIHKFRTMIEGADKSSQITVHNDDRITRVGKFIRGYRLDELPQLIDVFVGTVTFVGVRPETPKFVSKYTNEMRATLLLPAGVTNLACIYFKDEAKMLEGAEDAEKTYVEKILPQKMKYNLEGILYFSFWGDVKIIFKTVAAVFGKNREKK